MKQRLFFILTTLLCLSISITSCTKNPDDNHNPNGNNQNEENNTSFEGVYNLVMTYDSITSDDGTWWPRDYYEQITGSSYEQEYGYMTITKENGRYHMIATLVYDDTDETVTYFDTYATETNGVLVMDNSATTAPSGVVINFSFHDFANNLPHLYFKGICSLAMAGYEFKYLISFNGEKQQ